jgi:hypothetical protein
MPLKTITEATRRKTFAIDRSVIPMAFRVPMVEMFRKSMMSSPEIMLKPATMVIRIKMNSTLKSISVSQSNIWG